ncbi:TPA: hypothetical protein DEA21_00940 [Candidatus Uhrbacteria bacterium]|nr:hypothetical protein [Candidatus Uhrbacteria bacterium]HCU31576.1 hypothetical protein [Candidatus Uhrbacteria bacterium]
MKKITIVGFVILVSAFFVGCGKAEVQNSQGGDGVSAPLMQQQKIESDALSQAKSETALGSCFNSEDATCTEFFGSFWNETNMRLGCDSSRVFSLESCPSGAAGGCEIMVGQPTDVVTWLYFSDTVTEDSLKFSQMACEATDSAYWLGGR